MAHSPAGRPMDVLLVEDNLEDAGKAMGALSAGSVPCRVTLVCDGEEAMQFLHREAIFSQAPRPDLILLDLELPKKHGGQVLAEIRGDERLMSIPVVVLTASLVHKRIFKEQNLHVDEYMTKPVSWSKFINVVRTLRRALLEEVLLPTFT